MADLKLDAIVAINGLSGAVELNGLIGVVEAIDADAERVTVSLLDGSAMKKRIKPANLAVVPRTGEVAAYHGVLHARAPLVAGSRVMLHGLKREELNGIVGEILSHDTSSLRKQPGDAPRLPVRLAAPHGDVRLKPENLAAVLARLDLARLDPATPGMNTALKEDDCVTEVLARLDHASGDSARGACRLWRDLHQSGAVHAKKLVILGLTVGANSLTFVSGGGDLLGDDGLLPATVWACVDEGARAWRVGDKKGEKPGWVPLPPQPHLSALEPEDADGGTSWMRAQFGASTISCKARAAGVVGNELYITGGTLHRQTIDHVWSFSPRDLRWRQRPSLLAPRAHHGCVAHDGCLIVLGGSRPEPPGGGAVRNFMPGGGMSVIFPQGPEREPPHDSVEYFRPDGEAETWRNLPPMPLGVHSPGVAEVSGKIYVVCGFGGPNTSFVKALQVFDPSTQSWTLGPDMPLDGAASGGACAIGYGGRLFVNIMQRSGVLQIFDPATEQWASLRLPFMANPDIRRYASVPSADGRGFHMGTTPEAAEDPGSNANLVLCTAHANGGIAVFPRNWPVGARPLPVLWRPAICVDTGQVSEGTWTKLPDDPRPGISMDAPIVASLVY